MARETQSGRELKNTSYELFILLLSVLSIFNLIVFMLPNIQPIVKGVAGIVDGLVTIIFMGDFIYRLLTAPSKSDYFLRNWGWADLLASMPVTQLKIFRVFRIVKVWLLMRTFGVRNMAREILYNRAGSALYVTVFLVVLVLEFGGIAIVYIEAPAPDANITTSSDAVWWAFVTITTVGYGDEYPVTDMGRLVGMAVMTLGVSLFGVLTGFLANAFLSDDGQADESGQSADVATGDAANQLAEFKRLLAEQEQTNAALRAKLGDIEALLRTDD